MRWNILILFVVFTMASVSALVITPTQKYTIYSITGEEAVLFNVSLVGNEVCLIPKFEGSKTLTIPYYDTINEKWSTVDSIYTQPTTVKFVPLDTTLSERTDKINYLSENKDNKFCQLLDGKSDYYKLGEHSVIIAGGATYSADLYMNITEEALGFAHISMNNHTTPSNKTNLYYSFDLKENAGSNITYDLSGLHNDGKLMNGVTYNTSGIFNGGYNFNKQSQQINMTTSSKLGTSGTGNMAVSLWAYIKSTSEQGAFFNLGLVDGVTGNGFSIGVGDGTYANLSNKGNLMIGLYNKVRWINTTKYYNLGWNHVVMSINATGEPIFYLNGVNVYNSTGADMNSPTGQVFVGGYKVNDATNYARFFNGSLDEIMFFNMSLSADQVRDIYNNQSQRFYNSGEISFYNDNFSETTGTNMTNVSIGSCSTLFNGVIQMKMESGNKIGATVNLTNCNYSNYQIPGDANYINTTFILLTNTTGFYSPVMQGDITFDTWVNMSSSPAGDTTKPYFTTIPANASLVYNTALSVTFQATDETAFGTYKVNDTRFIISSGGVLENNTRLGVMYYRLNISINDTSGNSNFTIYGVNITKDTISLSIDFNPSNSIDNNTQSTVTGNGCINPLTCNLYRSDLLTSNPDIQNLTEGSYPYVFNTTGNQNYTIATSTGTLTVTNYTTHVPSNATTISASQCKYKKFGYYNLKLPWIRQEGCI